MTGWLVGWLMIHTLLQILARFTQDPCVGELSFVYYVRLCIVVDDMKKNINNNIIEDNAGPRRTRGASERAQTDEDDDG